jgi:trk system potassium uptake protein TrkH
MELLAVVSLVGRLVVLFALLMAVPMAFAVLEHDQAQRAFVLAFAVTGGAGVLMSALTWRAKRSELQPRDGFVLVALTWLALPAFGALPLVMALPGLSVTDAFFEAMSAFTATGATAAVRAGRPAGVGQRLALPAAMGGRAGDHRAGGGDPADAGCRRVAAVQGRDHGPAEGPEVDAAHRGHRACDMGRLRAAVGGLLRRPTWQRECRRWTRSCTCARPSAWVASRRTTSAWGTSIRR